MKQKNKADTIEQDVTEEAPKAEQQTERKKTPSKGKKKRKKKRYFLRFLIFCAVSAAAVLIMRSDLFLVTGFEVEGNRYYTEAQVIELSQLQTGHNLFFETPTKDARDRLLEDPYIKYVRFKKIPRGTVRLVIEERLEYAAIPYGGSYAIIDNEGYVLRLSDTEPLLPLLSGMSIIEMTPGVPLKVEQTYLLTDTLRLLSIVGEHDIFFKRIEFSAVLVKAYIYDDLYCEGSPENISDNMEDVVETLKDLYSDNINKGVLKVGKDGYISFSAKIE